MLIVGPSGVFMRYIERVLPSLGETAVALRSLGEVVDGVRADPPRRAGRRRRQGLGADGRADAAYGAAAGARQPAASSGSSGATTRSCSTAAGSARLRRQLMSQGRRNRQLPRVASTLLDAMWRQVRGERGRERGREAFDDEMLSRPGASSTSPPRWWPPLDAPEVLGWLRDPEFLARVGDGVLSAEEQRLLAKSWGDAADPLGRGRRRCSTSCATRSATCPARTDDERDARRHRAARGRRRHAGAVHRRRPRVRPDRPGLGAADPPDRGRPASPTCSSTRRRTSRRCSGGWSAGAAAPRPGRSSATRRSRRGRCRRSPPRPGPPRSRARSVHEFHLSTNYRNSSEIYAHAAAYAERVGLDADLPTAVRSTGVEPQVRHRRRPTSRPRPARPSPRSPARSAAPSASWCRSPAAREVNAWLASWPEFADDAPGRPRRGRLLGRRRRARTGSWCSPAWTPRAWSSTASSSCGPQEIEDESATGRATLYVVLTRATQLLTTLS